MADPSSNVGDAQKRVLLQTLASQGSGAQQAYDQGQSDINNVRQNALATMVAPTAQSGGVNDIGALADRVQGSLAAGNASRQADMAQRASGYDQYLGSAPAAQLAAQTLTDRELALQRAQFEYQTERALQLYGGKQDIRNQYLQADPLHAARATYAQSRADDPYGVQRLGAQYDAKQTQGPQSSPEYQQAEGYLTQAFQNGQVPYIEDLGPGLSKKGIPSDVINALATNYGHLLPRRPKPPV